MLLGQELKFKNKLCNFKWVPFSVTSQGNRPGSYMHYAMRPERAKALKTLLASRCSFRKFKQVCLVVSSKNRTFVLDYNNIKTIITANEET